ncbi:hypothetical protein DFH08DRAFT_978813 [Mycena albidolilacea]|uniref:Uncharacterized protein n=1 Tax=Mycena albidolilacea TaxID=1033008 RepID=A0AAD6YXT8_9AGAR|nr:hypothetical protein DFH08DRAFT_978813 [Mycena albidolilacea]
MQGATSAYSPIRATRRRAQFSPNELDSLTLNGVIGSGSYRSTCRRPRLSGARALDTSAHLLEAINLLRLPELDTEKLTLTEVDSLFPFL